MVKVLARDGFASTLPPFQSCKRGFRTLYQQAVSLGSEGRPTSRKASPVHHPIRWAFVQRGDIYVETRIRENELRRLRAARLARAGVGFAWIWHGLVPKILFRHPDEVLMLEDAGFPAETQWPLALTAGAVEIVLGLCVLVLPRARWPLVVTIVLMTAALIGVASTSPRYLTAAFNPVTLNSLMVVLSAVALSLEGSDGRGSGRVG